MHLGTNSFQVCIAPILKFISVLLKLQGSRAIPKHWPIEKIFGTDFFLHNWKGSTTSFQTFILYIYICVYVWVWLLLRTIAFQSQSFSLGDYSSRLID